MKKIIIITGPTAVGKTSVSLQIAEKYKTPIISADSMQVYKYMDIGTNKVEKEIRKRVKHFCIDIIEPDKIFTVYDYLKAAKKAYDIVEKQDNEFVLFCGGTGLYIKTFLYEIDHPIKENPKLRNYLEKKTNEELFDFLKKLDFEAIKQAHINNRKRIIRYIEIILGSGMKLKDVFTCWNGKSKYDFKIYLLTEDRDKLYKRIDERVDRMIQNGLIDEVKWIRDNIGFGKTAKEAIGYKQILNYLEDKTRLDDAVAEIKKITKNYAKRQITWFKKMGTVPISKEKMGTVPIF